MENEKFEHLLTEACKLILKKDVECNKDIKVNFSKKHERNMKKIFKLAAKQK